MFEEQVTPSINASSTRCLDDLALEFAKSNFASMQTKLDKIMVKNEEYWAQLPTLQNKLSIIQANLDHLQVERQDLEVKYWKVEMN